VELINRYFGCGRQHPQWYGAHEAQITEKDNPNCQPKVLHAVVGANQVNAVDENKAKKNE